MSGDFYVFGCPNCGRCSVKEVRIDLQKTSFKCKVERCNRSRKLKHKKIMGINIDRWGPYKLPREATEKCQELNNERRL